MGDASLVAIDPWLNLHDAARYCGFTTSGLRSCVDRGELRPDGRGPRKIAMFRRSTIDLFLAARAGRYPVPSHAVPGNRTTDEEISGRRTGGPKSLPSASEMEMPEDRQNQIARSNRRGRECGRGGSQASGDPIRSSQGNGPGTSPNRRRMRELLANLEARRSEAKHG